MKITWGEIKRNIRCVNHESPGAYEHEHQITPDCEFEFDLDVNDIDYYMLSGGAIKAVSRNYTMKEMFNIGLTNWDGEKITEINWNEKDNPGPQNKINLLTMEEWAASIPDKEEK